MRDSGQSNVVTLRFPIGARVKLLVPIVRPTATVGEPCTIRAAHSVDSYRVEFDGCDYEHFVVRDADLEPA